jgi:hypothetical protein
MAPTVLDTTVTCHGCPLQIEGTLDGLPVYFRFRYGQWWFGVGPEAVAVAMGYAEGFQRAGSCDSDEEAVKAFADCCREYCEQ